MDYVIRRPDPDDRRAKLIVLTEKGEACSRLGWPPFRAWKRE